MHVVQINPDTTMFSSAVPIPMIGVLIFVFYLFHQPPVLFNRQHDAAVLSSARGDEYRAMEREFTAAFDARRDAATAVAAARRSGDAGATGAADEAFREADGRMAAIRGKRRVIPSG